MRLLILPLIALSAALAGCGSGKTVTATDASVSDVAKKVADSGMKFNPGRWESTMKFVKLDMEGIPPEAREMMSKMLGKDRTFASCLSKEEAEKPGGKFFGQADDRCKYDTFAMGGGKIDAKMSCKSEHGTQAITMAGNYTADAYDMTMSINGQGPGGKAMSMQMALAAKHDGDCTGKEDIKDGAPG